MLPPNIVPATPADYPTIHRLAHTIWPPTFGNILSSAQIAYMLELMYSIPALTRQAGEGQIFHLLYDDRPEVGRPIGYLSHQLDYLPGTTKIHKIYLLPETQGRGYGKLLIEYAEQIARRAGQQRLRLDVNYQNRAIDFYEHVGFVKLMRYNTDIGNGYFMEDWQMERNLV
jgi:GNAT superfamily N-acetyltransferase